jgi:hypothetical protein
LKDNEETKEEGKNKEQIPAAKGLIDLKEYAPHILEQ